MANNLDRVVSSLGRNPLKVLVQVNTSGEVCEYDYFPDHLLSRTRVSSIRKVPVLQCDALGFIEMQNIIFASFVL